MSQIKPAKKFCYGMCNAWLDASAFKPTRNCAAQACAMCCDALEAKRKAGIHNHQKNTIIEAENNKKLSQKRENEKLAESLDKPIEIVNPTNAPKLVCACQEFADRNLRKEIDDLIGDCYE